MKIFYVSLVFIACSFSSAEKVAERKPNIVIVFLDDSGWGDFEPFNGGKVKTPNVSTLASEGCSYQNFYVPQAICSASRSALMSGCYPGRTKVFGAHGPNGRGLDPSFNTMGEVFQKAGYATAIFGKWHCGDQEDTRPHNRGFDEACGLMYSNDMWKHHPENPEYWGKFPIQFWENGKVKIDDVGIKEQKNLTKWYTEYAVDFIERKKDKPFLLYVPHSMPHVPIFCSDEFEGKSGKGIYGDVIMELDWSVGQINNALKKNGLEDNTIVIFTSDNGPWTSYTGHSGSTPFREAKATSFDGGVRSACIIKYPEQIKPATKSNSTFFSIDILPTLCQVADVPLPANEIDGKNSWGLIKGEEQAATKHKYYAISTGPRLESIMSGDGKWKLHLKHNYRKLKEEGRDGIPGKYEQMKIKKSLFNMEEDPYETTNVIANYPEIESSLTGYAASHLEKFYSEK